MSEELRKLYCYDCGKPVSSLVPATTVFRAVASCPECIEQQPDVDALLARAEHAETDATCLRHENEESERILEMYRCANMEQSRRAHKAEAQLAECHRLSALGGAMLGELRVNVESLIADNDRLEQMVERLIEAGGPMATLAVINTRRDMELFDRWQVLVAECKQL